MAKVQPLPITHSPGIQPYGRLLTARHWQSKVLSLRHGLLESMVHFGCAVTLRVLGHRPASGDLPPNSHPAAGPGSAPEGHRDGQTSKVNPGTFQQSRLSSKGHEIFFLSQLANFARAQESSSSFFFPAAPREAAR